MSLADLKKKKSKKTKKLSVEEFIDDAQAYARGESVLDHMASKETKVRVKRNKSTRTKHATFSLSENCIVQLTELAEQTGINKSKLIRMLVNKAKEDELEDLKDISDPDEKAKS